MKYRWILFDIDGTLLDFDRAEGLALERTFEHFGHHFGPGYGEHYRAINKELWRLLEAGRLSPAELKIQRFSRLFDAVDLAGDPVEYSTEFLAQLAQCSQTLEGAEETVRFVAQRARLMLITNGLASVQRPRMTASGLDGFFEDLVISEEVGAAKPDGRIFEEAFRRMGHPAKQDVLIIGDSLSSDIRGGVDFGIDTCWLNPQRRPGEPGLRSRYEIERLGDLPGLLSAGEV